MKTRITKLTKNAARRFFNRGQEFYVVPRYTRALSKGVLVNKDFQARFDNVEELKDFCRDRFHSYFLDFYMIY